MKPTTIALAFVCVALAGTAAAKTYIDNEKTVAQDCSKDPEATIVGNGNKLTFTGTCAAITVAGNENTVTIASVKGLDGPGNGNKVTAGAPEQVSVPGDRNQVGWKKGLSDKKAKLSDSGNDNKISQPK